MGTSTSSIIEVTTPAQGVAPGPATGLAISNVTSTSLTLSWTAPVTGSPPFDYQVQQSVAGGPFVNVGSLIVTNTTTNITGLTPGTAYQFQILSLNASSTTPSSPVSATTSATTPGAPTGLAVVGNPGPSGVTLQWVAPSAGTGTLTYQVYGTTPSGSNNFEPLGSPTTAVSISLSGLSSGATYDFYVNATNTAGNGPNSATLTGVQLATGAVLPSSVLNLEATVTQNSITPSWSPPSQGTPPLTYVVQYRPTP